MAASSDSAATPNSLPRQGQRNTLGEQTSKVAEDVRELGHIALAGAGEALQSVKESARDKGQQLLEKGKEKVETARDGFEGYVSENPFKAVLIAAGVGALIGYSLRSRR